MMISASSRAFVLNGETTTWRTKLRKAIIKADYLIVSVRPVDRVFGMDSSSLKNGKREERSGDIYENPDLLSSWRRT